MQTRLNKNFLFPELPPKQRFLKILEENVLPELKKDGFTIVKSGPSLKKKEGSFEWLVEFQASRWNSGNVLCIYNPYFTVKNSDYRKYLMKNPHLVHGYGPTGYIGTTAGKHHWNKRVFSIDKSDAYFLEDNDFSKYDNIELVNEMIQNIRMVGIPYFKMMSNFDTIKNFYISNNLRQNAPTLVDLCYVFGRNVEIQAIFDWYYTSKEIYSESLEEEMRKRKE